MRGMALPLRLHLCLSSSSGSRRFGCRPRLIAEQLGLLVSVWLPCIPERSSKTNYADLHVAVRIQRGEMIMLEEMGPRTAEGVAFHPHW